MSRILRNPGNVILPSMGKNIDQWTTIHQIGRGVLGTRYRVTNKIRLVLPTLVIIQNSFAKKKSSPLIPQTNENNKKDKQVKIPRDTYALPFPFPFESEWVSSGSS